jgi:hypothetical protein
VGKKFDADIHLSGDFGDATDATTRALLVRAVTALAALFLLVSGGMGLHSGDFNALAKVWAAVGPLYGALRFIFSIPSSR